MSMMGGPSSGDVFGKSPKDEFRITKIGLIIAIIVIAILAAVSSAHSQVRQYDSSGTYQGTIRQEGNRLVERDASGGIISYWITTGGQTSHYDANGNLIGRTRP